MSPRCGADSVRNEERSCKSSRWCPPRAAWENHGGGKLGRLSSGRGLAILLLDLDVQPTLSSYFGVPERAAGGSYELLAHNEQRLEQLVSHTAITHLDLVVSNDFRGQLNTLLLHAPDGRLRLRHLLPVFQPHYDLMLVDTQGARSVLLETAVLASDLAVSPVTPEILAARSCTAAPYNCYGRSSRIASGGSSHRP